MIHNLGGKKSALKRKQAKSTLSCAAESRIPGFGCRQPIRFTSIAPGPEEGDSHVEGILRGSQYMDKRAPR